MVKKALEWGWPAQRRCWESKKIVSQARVRPIINVDGQLLEFREVDHKIRAMKSLEAGRKCEGIGEGPSGVIQRV